MDERRERRMSQATWNACQAYLMRLGLAEYAAGMRAHVKAGRKAKTYRHNPSEYHRQLVELLGRGDEIGFKQLKMAVGYVSAAGA